MVVFPLFGVFETVISQMIYCFLLQLTLLGVGTSIKLRLAAGPDKLTGRLEVAPFRSVWGTVCDDHFDNNAANVVCKQMDHRTGRLLTYAGHPSSPAPPGNGIIWMDDVKCHGNETSLVGCMTKDWGHHACIHHEDVVITCYPKIQINSVGDPSSGQLEVLYDGIWGGVCSQQFNGYAVYVACTEIGYEAGILKGTYKVTGQMWLNIINCKGSESSVGECERSSWGSENCNTSTGVIIHCISEANIHKDLRLYGGGDAMSGVLEVKFMGLWGTVCYHIFDDVAAGVACREMGYTSGQYLRIVGNSTEYYPWQNHTIWLDYVKCTGQETSLSDCKMSPFGAHSCEHWQDVVMRCFSETPMTSGYTLGFYDGISPVSGRLKMRYAGVQFVFCQTSFDIYAVKVACKEMGMVSGGFIREDKFLNVSEWQQYATKDFIWKTNVHCHGNESQLADCFSVDWIEDICDIPTDVLAIFCTQNEQFTVPFGYDYNVRNPLIFTINGTERARLDIVTYSRNKTHEAILACREMGYENGIIDLWSFYNYRVDDDDKPEYAYMVSCYGYEQILSDCILVQTTPWLAGITYDNYVSCTMNYHFYIPAMYYHSYHELEREPQIFAQGDGIFGVLHMYIPNPKNRQFEHTICAEGISQGIISVICRGMGYKDGKYVASMGYEKRYGAISLGSIKCTGQENSMQECQGQIQWGNQCPENKDGTMNAVFIKCFNSTFNLRMTKGKNYDSGLLEVLYENSWEVVCLGKNSSDYAASLACTHLGYTTGSYMETLGVATNTVCGHGTSQRGIRFDDENCIGHEKDLFGCFRRPYIEDHACMYCLDANIRCWNEIRLSQQDSSEQQQLYGLLQMAFNGTWGSMCTGRFDNKAASVVCREIGFSRGRKYQNTDSENVEMLLKRSSTWFIYINCLGNETSTSQCEKEIWKAKECNLPVFVQCWHDYPESYQIRLADGDYPHSRRLEVLYQGKWGTVCSRYMGDDDGAVADVACKELGYVSGTYYDVSSYLFTYLTPTWLGEINCTGQESSLLECERHPWGDAICSNEYQIHVRCWNDSFQVRLQDGLRENLGRLEIKYRDSWGTVCSACDHERWLNLKLFGNTTGYYLLHKQYLDQDKKCDLEAIAKVACKMMGYISGKNISYPRYTYVEDAVSIWITYLRCRGDEHSLRDCVIEVDVDLDRFSNDYFLNYYYYQSVFNEYSSYNEYSSNARPLRCTHDDDLYIECYDDAEIRLVDGPSTSVGRLEIVLGNISGTVCDDLFSVNNKASTVACREMGYIYGHMLHEEESKEMVVAANSSDAPIWLDDVECDGTEARLADCRHAEWGQHNCDHTEDVVIQCFNHTPTTTDHHMVDDTGEPYMSTAHTWQTLLNTQTRPDKTTTEWSYGDTTTIGTEGDSRNRANSVQAHIHAHFIIIYLYLFLV